MLIVCSLSSICLIFRTVQKTNLKQSIYDAATVNRFKNIVLFHACQTHLNLMANSLESLRFVFPLIEKAGSEEDRCYSLFYTVFA